MTAPLISAALELWQLKGATVALISQRENHVYRLEHGSETYALRIHRAGLRSVEEIASELLWMDRLAKNGMLVPEPVQAIDGTTTQTVNGVIISVLTWVNGSPLSRLTVTAEMYYELGVVLSKMHKIAEAWKPAEILTRHNWVLAGDNLTWGKYWENPALTQSQALKFSEFNHRASELIAELEPVTTHLIHADLVPDNVLYTGKQFQIIDFDDGGFGHNLFDLATITHRSRRTKDNELAEAVIDGYSQSNSLDRQALALFEALRACSYVGWNISRMNEPDGIQRNNRFILEATSAIDAIYQ